MRKLILILIVLLSMSSGNLMAQQSGIQVGSAALFPTLGLTYGYDDNILFANDDALQLTSHFTSIAPGIRLEMEGERTDFTAQYDYNKTIFSGETKYNFDMHHLAGTLGYTASSRSRLELNAEYYNGSSRVGTGNQQGNLINLELDPDEWHSNALAGKWHYGGIGANGAIDLSVGTIDRQYDNNRVFTSTRDRRTNYFGATYAHTLSPKTHFLTQFKHSNINYENATLDNTETRLMFGAEWKATGKTSARALVGYLEKDFDNPIHDDFSGIAIEAGATWSPRSYSIFDLTLTRETDETNGNGSYVVRNSADVGWTHFWKDRFSTTANVGVSDENYKENARDDSLNYYGISASYQFSEWLMSGLGYRHSNRTSSVNDFEYTDNSVQLTLELSK